VEKERGIWYLGIVNWGLGIAPIPQSPIPNPQSPIPNLQGYIIFEIPEIMTDPLFVLTQ